MKSLGATEVIDYTKETVTEYCKGGSETVDESKKFNVVYDAATGAISSY